MWGAQDVGLPGQHRASKRKMGVPREVGAIGKAQPLGKPLGGEQNVRGLGSQLQHGR